MFFYQLKLNLNYHIYIQLMLNTSRKFSFSTSLLNKILVMDAGPMDILVNDFPQHCLDKEVSPLLKIDYLSICKKSHEEILKKTVYRGIIIGQMSRLFVSIPTKHPNGDKYYNIHYLVNTGSPITTLTRKALCAIHQKQYSSDYKHLEFPLTGPYQIGSQGVGIQCSNPDKESQSRPYHNVNLLGMNFFKKFQYVNMKQNIRNLQFILELSKTLPKDWDKNSI